MNQDGFFQAFASRELESFPLETVTGLDIYLCSLPWAQKKRFKTGIDIIAQKIKHVASRSDEDLKTSKLWNNSIESADEFLLKISMCNEDGSLMWKDRDYDFDEWLEVVESDVVEEIVYKIVKFNKLDSRWTPEDDKKKIQSSGATMKEDSFLS